MQEVKTLEELDALVKEGKARRDEWFDPIYGDRVFLGATSFPYEPGKELPERARREIVGYKGRESGVRVGTWFEEVME